MSGLRVFWKRYARHVVLPLGGLAITAAMLLPVYFTVVASLAPSSAVQALPQSLWPSHFVLSNYSSAIKFESGSVVTSLIISAGAVFLSLAVALPAAYGLTKLGYLNSRVITSVAIIVLLVTQMVPGISLTLSFTGLIVADSTYGVPFAVLVLRAFMASIPVELSEAAYVDGAGEWRTFRSVIAPICLPGVVTAGLFVFLFAWGDFIFAFTLTNGTSVTPLTVGILKFFTVYAVSWGPVLASVVFAAVPAGIILAFGQRYVLGGLRAGALKG
jgi:multiple sugar transport system permease protein